MASLLADLHGGKHLIAGNNVLKTEMQNLNLQMDEKVKQIQELNKMISSYQSRVEGSPQLEGQYLSLTRDLALAKQSYEGMALTVRMFFQPLPKRMPSARDKTGRKFHRQWPMTGTGDILTKLLLVRRENADAAPPARNCYIPLLRIRRRLDR